MPRSLALTPRAASLPGPQPFSPGEGDYFFACSTASTLGILTIFDTGRREPHTRRKNSNFYVYLYYFHLSTT
uniref:Uncharacterized protein n=1 Tax=Prolemur simus TaxID=1328070 RepID=A0A8C9DSE9_PROSS